MRYFLTFPVHIPPVVFAYSTTAAWTNTCGSDLTTNRGLLQLLTAVKTDGAASHLMSMDLSFLYLLPEHQT